MRTVTAILHAALLGLFLAAPPVAAASGLVAEAGRALRQAESAEERRCLAQTTRTAFLVAQHTGERIAESSLAGDHEEIVTLCREGRYAEARDLRAVIWADLTLHRPHSS